MSQEVNRLRKEGRVEEAYQRAVALYSQFPADIWVRRALAWVLYDRLKLSASRPGDACGILEEVLRLGLPADETMFYENLPWAIAETVRNIPFEQPHLCSQVFTLIRQLPLRPCTAFSVMFKAFHQHRAEWLQYMEFCEWWDFRSFMPDDYQPYRLTDRTGRMQDIMPLAEQAYIGYANAIIESQDAGRISHFLPMLKSLATQHPDYQYPPYYLSKLNLAIGNRKEAFAEILPFVKRKAGDFWVWQCLGDAAEDAAIRFSCYSKALTCRSKEEMLVKIKEQYAVLLAHLGYYDEAKTEVNQVVRTRQMKGWGIPASLNELLLADWYDAAREKESNRAFYAENAEDAELIIYPGICTETVFVTEVVAERQIANFVYLSGERGSFSTRKARKQKISVGLAYTLRIKEKSEKGRVDILSCAVCHDKTLWQHNVRDFSGRLRLFEGKGFGIVQCDDFNVFLPPALAKGKTEEATISGRAVKTFDKKQNRMGLTAFELTMDN